MTVHVSTLPGYESVIAGKGMYDCTCFYGDKTALSDSLLASFPGLSP